MLLFYIIIVGAERYEEARLIKLNYFGYSRKRDILQNITFIVLFASFVVSILLLFLDKKYLNDNENLKSKILSSNKLSKYVLLSFNFLSIFFVLAGLSWSYFRVFIIFAPLSIIQYEIFSVIFHYRPEHPAVYSLNTDIPAAFILHMTTSLGVRYIAKGDKAIMYYVSYALVFCVFMNHLIASVQAFFHL